MVHACRANGSSKASKRDKRGKQTVHAWGASLACLTRMSHLTDKRVWFALHACLISTSSINRLLLINNPQLLNSNAIQLSHALLAMTVLETFP